VSERKEGPIPGELVLRFQFDMKVRDMVREVNSVIAGAEGVAIIYKNTDEDAKIFRPTCKVRVPAGSEADWIGKFDKISGIALVYHNALRKYEKY